MPTSPETGSKPLENTPQPRIIPRSDHPISRKNIDREALKVLYRLRDAGFLAYLVGGGVRDLYLGKTPKDFDISTDARPGQIRKVFKNSRLIGRRFRLVQVFFHGGKIIEVSTFRCRSEFDLNGKTSTRENVLAANNTFGTPVDDAFRRDLTINGLFYEIENLTIIDYIDGVNDLEKGIIRFIGDPDRRIQRDPARMMRVVRHAARNGFTIEAKTWQAVLDHRDKLHLCPISRIRDELMKDLRSDACHDWAHLAMTSGILFVLFPFYEEILSPQENNKIRSLLLAVQKVIGRLHAMGLTLPDQLLFALLFLPWAVAEFDLPTKNYQKGEFHRFLRKIREKLDEILGSLSIRKEHKESIAMQFATLPQFIGFAKENRWPKWLRKKSYFRECDLFFRIFTEAAEGKRIPDHIARESVSLLSRSAAPARSSARKRHRKKGPPGPAFVSRKQGSIFGLK